jgi:hypothetical protein
LEGEAFSTVAPESIGTGAPTLLSTLFTPDDSACAPEADCSGLEEGFVYSTVTASPNATALARVNVTLVPETTTDVTFLEVEFTLTLNAETGGTTFARVRLYIMSIFDGVVLSMEEDTKTGTGGNTLFFTVCVLRDAACRPADVWIGLEDGFVYENVITSP